MRLIKILTVSLFCLMFAGAARAQYGKTIRTKSAYTRNRHNYRAPVVGNHKAKTICPIFENSKYPYQGVGFKLGDPFAFTYKLYPTKRFAFVADVGIPSSSLYSRQFRNEFTTDSADLVPEFRKVAYTAHKVKSDFVAELKILLQADVKKLAKGLQVYTGVGMEFRSTKIEYDFTYEEDSGFPEPESTDVQRTTQGVQAILGIEYAYFQIPVSAFMEMEYYVDISKDPGWVHLQGGIGLRYVF